MLRSVRTLKSVLLLFENPPKFLEPIGRRLSSRNEWAGRKRPLDAKLTVLVSSRGAEKPSPSLVKLTDGAADYQRSYGMSPGHSPNRREFTAGRVSAILSSARGRRGRAQTGISTVNTGGERYERMMFYQQTD